MDFLKGTIKRTVKIMRRLPQTSAVTVVPAPKETASTAEKSLSIVNVGFS
jgi:hypothetical protein